MIHIIIIGPSGSGKTTLQHALMHQGWHAVNSYTTRPMRITESENDPYHFVDDREFDSLLDDGDLGLVRSYRVANGETWRYGFPIADLRKTDLSVSVIDPDGYLELKDMVDEIFGIYMDIPDDVREYRLLSRGDRVEEIYRRMRADERDFDFIAHNFKTVCNLRVAQIRPPAIEAERVIKYVNQSAK